MHQYSYEQTGRCAGTAAARCRQWNSSAGFRAALPSHPLGSSKGFEKAVDNCCNRGRLGFQMQVMAAIQSVGLDMLETPDPLQQFRAFGHHTLIGEDQAGGRADGL